MRTTTRLLGALALLLALSLPNLRADQAATNAPAKTYKADQGTQDAIAILFPVGGSSVSLANTLGFPDKEVLLPNHVRVLTYDGVCFCVRDRRGLETPRRVGRGQFYPGSTTLRITLTGSTITKVVFD